MTNRLASENSPYLLQHQHNPVDWYPWGEEALAKAVQEDKPIFLSIGYAACHWCHVMAHESFEDTATAALMNEKFVNIKVDREERPDLDSIYMNAVVAITGQGGWPMSLFLTPDGYPFFGGTYYPPQARYGMPSFQDVLLAIDKAWKNDRARLLEASQELIGHLRRNSEFGEARTNLSSKVLEIANKRLTQSYDWENAGWGKAPKFPQPITIQFLIRRASRGDPLAGQIVEHVLDAMALGGMYDVIGGGFARYSTDNHWLVPHFEKMLYDNAQLARAYLHAYLVIGKDDYRRVCTETFDFIIREMAVVSSSGGGNQWGFFSSLDADSDGEEGKYNLWTADEIHQALSTGNAGLSSDYEFFVRAYGVHPDGNFEGKTVLQRAASNRELADQFNIPTDEVVSRLARLHSQLLIIREQRIRPGTDDKILTSWNGLALMAFAEAARYLKRPDYLEIARANAQFLLQELYLDGRLLRSWRNGKAQHEAYLEDYASLILGLLALYQSDPDTRWYSAAETLAMDMLAHFQDPQGGFFDTRENQPGLIIRARDIQDNATPSGNALAALALLQLSIYSGNERWRSIAERMLASIIPTAERYPTAFAQWLIGVDFCLAAVQEVAILGGQDLPGTEALIDTLWKEYRPDLLAAISSYPPETKAPALLQERPLRNGLPTAYVCRRFVCQSPVNTAKELSLQLNDSNTSVTGQ